VIQGIVTAGTQKAECQLNEAELDEGIWYRGDKATDSKDAVDGLG
jgi:hypothetical protein